jgi:heparin binding hemagglutinin HbhA
MAEKNQPTIEDLKAPLLAAVGAADLALATVNEIVAALRERAEEARTDAEARVGEGRARITKLQEELPSQVDEIRGRLNSDELRKAAEGYAEAPSPARPAPSASAPPSWSASSCRRRPRRLPRP